MSHLIERDISECSIWLMAGALGAEQIATAIRAATGISHEKEIEQGLYWIRLEMCRNVLKKPSISHTELLGSVQGNSDLKELAINQLVKQGELRCAQKGRARKYYPKDY